MTSLVKAIQERLAKICDALQEKFEHRGYDLSEGARQCAYAIRAADLEEFERELAALTARLEAKGAECEKTEKDLRDCSVILAMSGNQVEQMFRRAQAAEAKCVELEKALAISILWALDNEGGYTSETKKYHDWAVSIKETIPSNPRNKDILDDALKERK